MSQFFEYTVEEDGDPMAIILYRGPDEDKARQVLAEVHVINGWGAVLYRRLVGPREVIEVRR